MKLKWPWSADIERIERTLARIEHKLDLAIATTAQAATLAEALHTHTTALQQSLTQQPTKEPHDVP